MKKLIIATSVALCLSTTVMNTSFASTKSKDDISAEEQKNALIGFSSGMATGALIGGPVGAIVGGVFGVLIADDVNDNKELTLTRTQLQRASGQLATVKQQSKQLKADMLAMEQRQMMQLASLDEDIEQAYIDELTSFETRLQFRTASFVIEDVYKDQLNSLASLLVNYPYLKVAITGYADKRGDASYNKELSELRAKSVKTYLISKNVNAQQLIVKGAGEINIHSKQLENQNHSLATNVFIDNTETGEMTSTVNDAEIKQLLNAEAKQNAEDLFYARKVSITFVKHDDQLTAAN